MRILKSLLFSLLLASTTAAAQGSGASTLAGRCGSANWVCVAQCIDVTCIDRCLATGCEKALASLVTCAASSRCGSEDTGCVARACNAQCDKSFEPAGPSPEKETVNPCAGGSRNEGSVPSEAVGDWVLEAASILPEERERLGAQEGKEVKPRPDYARTLRITRGGCFLMETRLDDATLGKGNKLAIRSWGALKLDPKSDTATLATKDGQAVGPVCGKERAISLSKGKFKAPRYEWDLEDGDSLLTFTAKTSSRQTFQFRRKPPGLAP